MKKTSKKILLTLLLFIVIALLQVTKVSATNVDKAELFKKFKENTQTDIFATSYQSNLYPAPIQALTELKPKVKVEDNSIIKWEKVQNSTRYYFRTQGKEGTTKATVSITYKGKTAKKVYTFHIFSDYKERYFEQFKATKMKKVYNIFVGEQVYAPYALDLKATSTNKKVANSASQNNNVIIGKKAGKTTITVTATYNGKKSTKKFTVKVKKVKDAKIKSKNNDVDSISEDLDGRFRVLLTNGELWTTDEDTYKLKDKVADNVKKQVYSAVYEKDLKSKRGPIEITNLLKKNKKLEIKSSKQKKVIKNVLDVESYYYITKNKKLYEITNVKGKLKMVQKMKGVDKIFNSDLIRKDKKLYTIEGKKISNKKVKEAMGHDGSGLFLTTKNELYQYTREANDKYKETLVEKKVETILSDYVYKTKKGKVKAVGGGTNKYIAYDSIDNIGFDLASNGKLYANGIKVLTNVADIKCIYNIDKSYAYITKRDGSIWVWSKEKDKDSKFFKIRNGNK